MPSDKLTQEILQGDSGVRIAVLCLGEKRLCPGGKYRRIHTLCVDVPLLRYVRGAPRFSPGVSIAPN